jgi:hypothetical protein
VLWFAGDGTSIGAITTLSGSSAIDGPALAADGPTAVVGYLGTETPPGMLHASFFSAGSFAPPGTLAPTSGSAPTADSAARFAIVGGITYAVYAGFNEGLYVATNDGSGWATSQPINGAGSQAFITPGVAIDPGNLAPVIYFSRNTDHAICSTALVGGSWTSPPACIPNAVTDRTPAVLVTAAGTFVAWHDQKSQSIFAAHETSSGWSGVITIDGGSAASSAPAITAGLGSDDAEIVWVSAGVLRHAKLVADAPTVEDTGVIGVSEVDATIVTP